MTYPLLGDDLQPTRSTEGLAVPALLALDASGQVLLWEWFGADGGGVDYKHDVDPRGALARFVGIRDAEGVLRFARRYGVLMLCDHGLPCAHSAPSAGWSTQLRGCEPMQWHDRVAGQAVHCEPVEIWLSLARRFKAFRGLAMSVRNECKRDPALWDLLLNEEVAFESPGPITGRVGRRGGSTWRDHDLQSARLRLAFELQKFLDLGGARFSIRWDNIRPVYTLGGGLFATISVQALQELAGSDAVLLCYGCGTLYPPARKPRWGANHYCEICRENGVPARDRQREFRSRKHEQAKQR